MTALLVISALCGVVGPLRFLIGTGWSQRRLAVWFAVHALGLLLAMTTWYSKDAATGYAWALWNGFLAACTLSALVAEISRNNLLTPSASESEQEEG